MAVDFSTIVYSGNQCLKMVEDYLQGHYLLQLTEILAHTRILKMLFLKQLLVNLAQGGHGYVLKMEEN